jgi:hypothetical protein
MQKFWLFIKAILKRWWAFMSCAVFTFIGLYAAFAGKSNHWVVLVSGIAAIALFTVATYGAWLHEHKRAQDAVEQLNQFTNTAKPTTPVQTRHVYQEWKDLATKFESLSRDPLSMHVRADWQCQRNNNRTIYESWNLTGVGNQAQIEAICLFAGTLLMKSPTVIQQLPDAVKKEQNPAWRWLFLLKATSLYFKQDSSYGKSDDGTLYFMGSLRDLAAASVDACVQCAAAEMS